MSSAAGVGALVAGLAVVAAVAVAVPAQAAEGTVGLGSADAFAVLAGSGITNTGMTTITGDVGSSPTSSETGFAACPGANCVTLTGTNHTDPNPNDAVTQQAKTALTTAYNDAAGRIPTLVGTELAGQEFVSGVYAANSGTFGMSGTLTLNGGGNPNAVFIFQTSTTLVTGTTGNVRLVNGAQACNVFWKIGSAATLGASSTFRGTILAHDDISLGNAVTVDGRLLAGEQDSGAGAVTLIGDTITRPTCAPPASTSAPAPVTTTTSAPVPVTTTTSAALVTTTTEAAVPVGPDVGGLGGSGGVAPEAPVGGGGGPFGADVGTAGAGTASTTGIGVGTASSRGALANTGVNRLTLPLLVGGLGLLAAGVVLLLVGRLRRHSETL